MKAQQKNWIIAINMGVLVNFKRQAEVSGEFNRLIEFLDNSGILTSHTNADKLNSVRFSLLSFRDYPLFDLDDTGATSQFYDALFDKVATQNEGNHEENPFYKAYLQDKAHYSMRLTHHNYELFCRPEVRETLKYLLIKIQIESKVIISTRALLELLHDIIVPDKEKEGGIITYQQSLPYLLFGGLGDSLVIKKINEFDPLSKQNRKIEELMSHVYNSQASLKELVNAYLNDDDARSIDWLWNYFDDDLHLHDSVGFLLRIKYLLERKDSVFDDATYTRYLHLLNLLTNNAGSDPAIHQFYKAVKQFIYNWSGSPQDNYIFTYINAQEKFGVAVPFELEFKGIMTHDFDIIFDLKNTDAGTSYHLVIDYDLFKLITRVNNGYLLKK
ncbi:DNA phosphorothioation-dependent restriction protein DptF [Secundilactobacillus collinoides]|uniref:DNA phosphorothioation-dependent restriction protein DptF n=1 Tax=Secundilactobacillus collinoides TaxID=33960 RepID=UPI001584BC8E|nr:DNA phosphorothioation-dependent restriction protein DptF [Secundilactobacillus collinoides]